MNPVRGVVAKADGGPRQQLHLAPYESRVLLFSKENEKGGASVMPTADLPAPVDISSDWKVTLAGSSKVMPQLGSWTEDEATKYYSGQATYEKTVNVPAALLGSGHPIHLDFGQGTPVAPGSERRPASGMRAMLEAPVREAAVVYVNGTRAGSVWCAPYELNVTGQLKVGQNSIRVVVANLAVNVLAKGPLPDYKELTAKYGEKFQAQDMNLVEAQPSGLLGPVRLVVR
jgi:hypothetical protein